MNYIALLGRITRDLELRKTQSGTSVCTFTIAVNRDYGDGADFIDCVAWKGQAEVAAKYLSKGRNVLVAGSLQSRKYKDKNGNNRTAWEVQISKLDFVDKAKRSEGSGEQAQFDEIDDDGELPFA